MDNVQNSSHDYNYTQHNTFKLNYWFYSFTNQSRMWDTWETKMHRWQTMCQWRLQH